MVAAGILAVAAIIIAYVLASQPQQAPDPWAGRETVYMEDFADNLASASEVYLVMDLRGAETAVQRNIMQCSADMAFSTALGGKSKKIYSLDTECLKIGDADGENPETVPLSQCLSEINAARDDLSKAIFYVRKANSTMVYANELVIAMGAEYDYMGCSITSSQPQAPAGNTTAANGTSN